MAKTVKVPRGAKKLYEGRLLGCDFETDDESVAALLGGKIDHDSRRFLEPIAQAALCGVRELGAQRKPSSTIKLVDGKVTVYSGKSYGETASKAYDVVRLPTKTDPPGE